MQIENCAMTAWFDKSSADSAFNGEVQTIIIKEREHKKKGMYNEQDQILNNND